VYADAHTNMNILCKEHGIFLQNTNSHLKGRGCPQCSITPQQEHNTRRNKKIASEFIAKATKIHNGIFDYTGTVYIHNLKPVHFRCIEHDKKRTQTAGDHLDGYNPCTRCNHMKSKDEDTLAKFLSIFTPTDRRNRQLIKPKEIDIYLSDHKLAVEYCGVYYHSHADIKAENKEKTKHYEKYIACKALGIRLITIFENEYLDHAKPLKRLLRNMIGASKGKLMARNCEVRKVVTQEAKLFYDKYHIQGGAGGGEHYGLYWKDKLVACMRFSFGANDRGSSAAKPCWTLGRYATRITVSGGASRLFKAFIKEHNPQEVKSFSDNRYFDGGMYAQLEFKLDKELPMDYQVWSQRLGMKPKSHYQRRAIPQRLLDHKKQDSFDPATDPRTEQVMTYLMGARRIYDCGKKRWLWQAQQQATQKSTA
jgi:hypothetical protein